MNILLIGYGKMGKTLEGIARQRGHQIAGTIDVGDDLAAFAAQVDVAIEFTQPEAVVKNLMTCLDKKIPVVCGTTGWLKEREAVEGYCRKQGGTLFHSSNFSLGVNIFFKMNEYLARMMDRYPQYEISIDETHHTHKKDAPSGTAITLAEGVLKHVQRKKSWMLGATQQPEVIPIQSHRIDPAPGTHVVTYRSAIDDLEITHTAHSREGFALGAVLVAEWVVHQKGVLTMDDFLKF